MTLNFLACLFWILWKQLKNLWKTAQTLGLHSFNKFKIYARRSKSRLNRVWFDHRLAHPSPPIESNPAFNSRKLFYKHNFMCKHQNIFGFNEARLTVRFFGLCLPRIALSLSDKHIVIVSFDAVASAQKNQEHGIIPSNGSVCI